MVQAGAFGTPRNGTPDAYTMGAGNGLRTYDSGMPDHRQSHHPSIDGDEVSQQRETYGGYGDNRYSQPNYGQAYDGYNSGPAPQRQSSHGYAYGGNSNGAEGYGSYGGFDQNSERAYNVAGHGAGQRYYN